MTPFDQGYALGRQIARERPLPMELRERLAVMLRPVAEPQDRRAS